MARLTDEQRSARIAAFEEAADHLDMDWTDNPEERSQSKIVSAKLRAMADKLAVTPKSIKRRSKRHAILHLQE